MREIKDKMIVRILAQESPKSESWLKRHGKKKLWEPNWNFWKVARAIFRNIFGFQGFCLEYGGLRLDLKQRQVLFIKLAWIYRF
jgi:hypothetical protein